MKINNVSFGAHQSILKRLFKQGLIPQVKYGFYGDILTPENVSVEHLRPFARSQRSDLFNTVLASQAKNQKRGSIPLWKFINIDAAKKYLEQFREINVQGFNGNNYIQIIIKNLKNIGIDLDTGIIKPPKQIIKMDKPYTSVKNITRFIRKK